MALRVKRLSENAVLPVRQSPHAAGYDLSSAHAAVVPRHGKALVQVRCVGAACPCTHVPALDGSLHRRARGPLWQDCSALFARMEEPYRRGSWRD